MSSSMFDGVAESRATMRCLSSIFFMSCSCQIIDHRVGVVSRQETLVEEVCLPRTGNGIKVLGSLVTLHAEHQHL